MSALAGSAFFSVGVDPRVRPGGVGNTGRANTWVRPYQVI